MWPADSTSTSSLPHAPVNVFARSSVAKGVVSASDHYRFEGQPDEGTRGKAGGTDRDRFGFDIGRRDQKSRSDTILSVPRGCGPMNDRHTAHAMSHQHDRLVDP